MSEIFEYKKQWFTINQVLADIESPLQSGITQEDILINACKKVPFRPIVTTAELEDGHIQADLFLDAIDEENESAVQIDLFFDKNIENDFHETDGSDTCEFENLEANHNILNRDQENISVYIKLKDVLEVKAIDATEDIEPVLGYIGLIGFVKLGERHIKDLINTQHTVIKRFSLPPASERNKKELLSYIECSEGLNCDIAHVCVINGQGLRVDGYDPLYIHASDLDKLKQRFLVSDQVEDIKADTRKKDYEIDHYRCAASNCLAYFLWKNYPNIDPTRLRAFWGFAVIVNYNFDKISDLYYRDNKGDFVFCNIEKPPSLVGSPLSTVQSWIVHSAPSHITIKPGSPGKEKTVIYKNEMEMLTSEVSDEDVIALLKVILISIQYYRSGDESDLYADRIDLLPIVEKIEKGGHLNDEFFKIHLSNLDSKTNLGKPHPIDERLITKNIACS